MRDGGFDAVLGENALLDQYLALATGLPPAADTVDIHAELSSGIQQRRACCDMPLAPRRLKDHFTVLVAERGTLSVVLCFGL